MTEPSRPTAPTTATHPHERPEVVKISIPEAPQDPALAKLALARPPRTTESTLSERSASQAGKGPGAWAVRGLMTNLLFWGNHQRPHAVFTTRISWQHEHPCTEHAVTL